VRFRSVSRASCVKVFDEVLGEMKRTMPLVIEDMTARLAAEQKRVMAMYKTETGRAHGVCMRHQVN
jgi:hypothetical protein